LVAAKLAGAAAKVKGGRAVARSRYCFDPGASQSRQSDKWRICQRLGKARERGDALVVKIGACIPCNRQQHAGRPGPLMGHQSRGETDAGQRHVGHGAKDHDGAQISQAPGAHLEAGRADKARRRPLP